MSEQQSNSSGGIGFTGLLTLLFIGLKLGGVGPVAHWSWWWVLSPLWIGFGLVLVFLVIAAIIVALATNSR